MLRVKIFAIEQVGDVSRDVTRLEEAIDHWIESEQPVIRRVMQSISNGIVVLTFLYDDPRREARSRTVSDRLPEALEREADDAELDSTDEGPDILPEAELPY